MLRKRFPIFIQLDKMDCGPTCLRMIAKFYGKHFSLQTLRQSSHITREGVSLKGISEAATKIGFRTLGAKLTFEQLDKDASLPCILYWNQKHFVVLPPQDFDINKANAKILIADPRHGLIKVSREVFLRSWISTEDNFGIALLLEPTQLFYNADEEKSQTKGFSFLFQYLEPYKKYILQLFAGMLAGSILSLVAPFLTQSLVDYGINQQNLSFVYLILFCQIGLFFGSTAIEMIRGWLLLHMSTRINISIISDFLIKLMKLPIRFFDTKMVGDITQRVSDHRLIEEFLTGTSLTTLFSLVNLIVFSIVLGIYSLPILFVFILGSLSSMVWIIFFMRRRREINYARFQSMSDNQNSLIEIINGMQDIKINDSETTYRWGWERVQAKLFKLSIRSLSLAQYQTIGSGFFTQLKNILATFIAAKEVINGNITLGMMLSVSYIIGQMNSPIEQLIAFVRSAQDAKISLERLSEIHMMENEEKPEQLTPEYELELQNCSANVVKDKFEPFAEKGIVLKNISFQYGGPSSPVILDDISITIPFGKVTAIVGASGSGKTTLMKLLLKFYSPINGTIHLGSSSLESISPRWWRKNCGVVMSDGYIFSDTMAKNISVQDDFDWDKLIQAATMANINGFISGLPLGYSTKIGNTGNGLSSGQKQRILIARAIYKEPKFIFLDEATSTLDANNERVIVENLERFSQDRTVVVIAHRLSTVKHADQIIVMENGKVVEIGDHNSLTFRKGKYFELVKNQLELGS
ncbi:peptidase domain-containing ABC transporter [Pedobacter sp. GR22-10]|uniref:peptidase domain-containing ABC transporter n=1 Tax=Pedobacter sp. GR22-10 TaxID=2994472 RepID=UPI0022460315|nr:peptidase domain-containing ABC transporter [Pedobacter sp. GR22-10]MCX2432964.1 peptidase domain-containing ABC transporter [Pedobacter sp. GR22-10]